MSKFFDTAVSISPHLPRCRMITCSALLYSCRRSRIARLLCAHLRRWCFVCCSFLVFCCFSRRAWQRPSSRDPTSSTRTCSGCPSPPCSARGSRPSSSWRAPAATTRCVRAHEWVDVDVASVVGGQRTATAVFEAVVTCTSSLIWCLDGGGGVRWSMMRSSSDVFCLHKNGAGVFPCDKCSLRRAEPNPNCCPHFVIFIPWPSPVVN